MYSTYVFIKYSSILKNIHINISSLLYLLYMYKVLMLISSPTLAVTVCSNDTNLHCPTADVLNQCPHTILYRSPEGTLG